jgi:branched-chain amino acid transport system substrate-binding protein
MNSRWVALCAACVAATALALPARAADKIKIGVISTFSGPSGFNGTSTRDAMNLAVEHLGGKIGGLPVELLFEDDQQKPDQGVSIANKYLRQDKVDVILGSTFSNVTIAMYVPIVKAETVIISTIAGPSQIAGKGCSPYFFSTSWQNDQPHAAAAVSMERAGIKNVALIASNYQAGQDALSGFKSKYKNKIVDEIYVPLNQLDFSAEITKIAAEKPDAIYAFIAGAGTLPFAKQYVEAGLMKQIPLYSAFMFNSTTLPAVGDVALGARSAAFWTVDLDIPANKKFVAAFRKKYNYDPSVYSAQAYDSVYLIDAAVREIKGKVEDRQAFIKALATVKYDSVRGPYKYNNNHFPIENFYATEIVKAADGHLIESDKGVILKDDQDAYHKECPLP